MWGQFRADKRVKMGDGGDDENHLDEEESNYEDWFFKEITIQKINRLYEKELETHICSYCMISILKF